MASPTQCIICGVTKNIKKCSGCQQIAYCSVDHQRKHWPTHKLTCSPPSSPFKFEIDSNTVSGKLILADKNFETGALIVEESPLFFYNPITIEEDTWGCVCCGVKIGKELDSKLQCSDCSWPVCSPECQKAPIHANNECKIFAHNQILPTPDKPTELILTARAFGIRSQTPNRWKEILETISKFSPKLPEFEGLDQIQKNIIRQGKSISTMKSKFPLLSLEDDSLVKEEIQAQMAVLSRLVGFSSRMTNDLKPVASPILFYKTSSHFSHACAANCVWDIGPAPDFKIKIRAATEIEKGEQLTINRQGYLYLDTRNRQEKSLRRFNKLCTCFLCGNSRELGTFQGAIVCPSCKENGSGGKMGYLLPVDPLDENKACKDNAVYECSVCGAVQLASTFLPRLQELRTKIKEAEGNKESLKNVILELSKEEQGSFLHQNHWIMQKAMVEYVELCQNQEEGGKEENMERLKYLLNILEKTCPGIQHERVRVMQLLGNEYLNQARQAVNNGKIVTMTKEEIFSLDSQLKEMLEYFKGASLYWTGVPTSTEGNKQVEVLNGKIEEGKILVGKVEARISEL